MNRYVHTGAFAAAILGIWLASLAGAAQAAVSEPFVPIDPIMPISQVKPGMRGECRTVISGSDVVTFQAEVVDVIPSSGAPSNLIMIRAYGPVIERTGGIASGMSGSPFYIGGRLVGAIGYGWPFSRHDLGLVTPIEDMIKLWDNPEIIPSFEPAPIIPEKPPAGKSGDEAPARSLDILLRGQAKSADADQAISDLVITSSDMQQASMDIRSGQIFVSGVSPRMARSMGEIMGREVTTYGGGPFTRDGSSAGNRLKTAKFGAALEPGMAVGASLLWGDVEISGLGTLTAVARDGRFIAFAHPFMDLGPTSAALTEANISAVVPGVQNPFKVGTTGDIVGIVTQDRPQGIGGRIGRFAPAAGCTINMLDVDSGRRYRRSFQIVQDMYQLPLLAPTAIVGLIENLWGRVGGGSAKITATYSGNALPEGWKRTNVFVSDKDVAKDMLAEFNLMTKLFAENQFQELRPFGIDVDVELTQEPRVLYIDDVDVPKGPFRPGERVSFDITLRPWRKTPFVRTYSLVIPEKVTGICELLIRGGGIAEENAEYMDAAWRSISSLPILLKEIDAKETNDQIVLEIRGQEALADQIKRAQRGDPDDLMNDKLKSEIREEKMNEGSMRIIRTNYYVDGIIHRLIRVEGESQGDGPSEDPDGEPSEESEEQI